MTFESHPKSIPSYESPPIVLTRAIPEQSAREWKWWGIGMLAIATFYAALLNPYWVPSGDGDLYIGIARSLALGQGFKFNGQSVNICPPGWPLILAGLMKISPTFLLFKIVLVVCQTLQLGMWYWLLKRMVPVKTAILAVALTAILNHVYSLTFWTHTEAVYCVVSTGATLIAIQLAESRNGFKWRAPLLLLLCFLCVFIRFAGVLQFVMIGAALVHSLRFWELKNKLILRQTIVAVLSITMLWGSLKGLQRYLKLTRAQEIAASDAGAMFEEGQAPPPQAQVEAQDVKTFNIAATRNLTVYEEVWRRFNESGRWISWLCWQPFRFTSSLQKIAWLDIVVGWIAIATLLVTLVKGITRFHWMWLGAAAYCGVLMINWPNANARYLVPIAPLLLAGILTGARDLFSPWKIDRKRLIQVVFIIAVLAAAITVIDIGTKYVLSPAALWSLAGLGALRLILRGDEADQHPPAATWLLYTFAATVVLCNVSLYAIDVRVARSNKFYDRYEAGFNSELISTCFYLNQIGLKDGELAVSEKYQNLGRVRKSKFAVRAANLLTNRIILTVKDKMAGEPKPALLRWLQGRKLVKFYLDQRPNVPWRVWHFKLSRELNQKLIKEPLGVDESGWKLYRVHYERVPATQPASQPTTDLTIQMSLPATTQASTQPAMEWRRSADYVAIPEKHAWPTRVPGM